MGTTRRVPCFSSQSICHGTMFEWCSRAVMTTSSPAPTARRPYGWAPRLMPSVAPRTKTIWTPSRRVLRDPPTSQPASQQVLAPVPHRLDADPAQHLAGEPIRQQCAGGHLVEPAALEIEDRVLGQLAIGRPVAALHVVGE